MFFPRIANRLGRTLSLASAVSIAPFALVASMVLAPAALIGNAFADDSANDPPRVRLVTSKGDMVIELAEKRAPITVKNFLQYVDDGFYDGTIFHRVIEGFMIQGGGFNAAYERKSTRQAIPNEANNGLRNERYSIAMARTNAPHSATAQFFINSEDNHNLDHSAPTARGWGYAVFGRVVEGQNIVDQISQVATGPAGRFSRDAPREQIVITEARLIVPAPVEPSVQAENADENQVKKTNSADVKKQAEADPVKADKAPVAKSIAAQ